MMGNEGVSRGAMASGIGRVVKGVSAALRTRPGVFATAATAVLLLNVLVPPLVLSMARKPVDYFTVNPWLRRLPEYLASPAFSPGRKIEAVWSLALLWFSSDSPQGGVEWGFAVDVGDLVRFLVLSALFGAYFALWAYQRDRLRGGAWPPRSARGGGVTGVLTSVFGLTTGPCGVMGCGAPVIPVVGLAFAGLSSGTLSLLAGLSRTATAVLLVALVLAVAYFGWRAGAPRGEISAT